jgi:MFS family permease
MKHFHDPAPGSYRRWAILVIGTLNFVISMFYRVSTAVIAPALVRDLGLSSAQLGDLSAAFFYAFAATQIPVGMSIDRLGTRITIILPAIAGVGGALLFSAGHSSDQLILARVLLGIGMSGNFMVLLTLLAAWFPVDRFAFLSGAVVAAGTLGTLLSATPLALLAMWIGWRESFLIFAIINAAIVLIFVSIVKDGPSGAAGSGRRTKSPTKNLVRLARMPAYWVISLANFVRYGYLAALQGLWAGPFLIYGLGFGEIAAGNAILCMGIGYMIGLPLSGSISDRVLRSRKKVALAALALFCVFTVSAIPLTRGTGLWVVFVIFFGMGLSSGPGNILYAHMKELLPRSMTAQAMTSVNLFTILGAGIMTHLLSMVIGREPSDLTGPEDFRAIWYVGIGALVLAGLLYAFVPDSRALRERNH